LRSIGEHCLKCHSKISETQERERWVFEESHSYTGFAITCNWIKIPWKSVSECKCFVWINLQYSHAVSLIADNFGTSKGSSGEVLIVTGPLTDSKPVTTSVVQAGDGWEATRSGARAVAMTTGKSRRCILKLKIGVVFFVDWEMPQVYHSIDWVGTRDIGHGNRKLDGLFNRIAWSFESGSESLDTIKLDGRSGEFVWWDIEISGNRVCLLVGFYNVVRHEIAFWFVGEDLFNED